MAPQHSQTPADPPPASMLLQDQLCFALHSASRAVQAVYRPLLDQLDLTYPQYLVLLVLWENDDLTVSQIGNQLFLNSATLTPLLKRMEDAALVERVRSSTDERQVHVLLTPDGRALQAEVQQITTAVTCAATEASDDAGGLLAALVQLRERLHAE